MKEASLNDVASFFDRKNPVTFIVAGYPAAISNSAGTYFAILLCLRDYITRVKWTMFVLALFIFQHPLNLR